MLEVKCYAERNAAQYFFTCPGIIAVAVFSNFGLLKMITDAASDSEFLMPEIEMHAYFGGEEDTRDIHKVIAKLQINVWREIPAD